MFSRRAISALLMPARESFHIWSAWSAAGGAYMVFECMRHPPSQTSLRITSEKRST
jgi:hypothetical protein